MRKIAMKRCLLMCVLATVAAAHSAAAADKWVSVRSKNFLLVGNASASAIRRVARDLEEFRAAFAQVFPGFSRRASEPITVVVFKNDSGFRPYKPLYRGKPASLAGFY